MTDDPWPMWFISKTRRATEGRTHTGRARYCDTTLGQGRTRGELFTSGTGIIVTVLYNKNNNKLRQTKSSVIGDKKFTATLQVHRCSRIFVSRALFLCKLVSLHRRFWPWTRIDLDGSGLPEMVQEGLCAVWQEMVEEHTYVSTIGTRVPPLYRPFRSFTSILIQNGTRAYVTWNGTWKLLWPWKSLILPCFWILVYTNLGECSTLGQFFFNFSWSFYLCLTHSFFTFLSFPRMLWFKVHQTTHENGHCCLKKLLTMDVKPQKAPRHQPLHGKFECIAPHGCCQPMSLSQPMRFSR
jgi:hypothetical protein